MPLMGQKAKADSLAKLLSTEKEDTTKVTLMWQMAEAYSVYNPDTALQLTQKALFLSQYIKYAEGESRTLGIIANTFMRMGNYPQALNFNIKKLKLEEQRDKPRNLASVLMNIGSVYALQDQLPEALKYYKKSDSVIRTRNIDELRYYSFQNLGDVYYRMNILDSAFLYFQLSLDIAKQINEPQFTGASYAGLAHVHLKKGDHPAAVSGYRQAIGLLEMAGDGDLFCEATLGLANVYRRMNMPDSSILYARNALSVAQKGGFLSRQLEAARFLSEYYKTKGVYDSAFSFISQVQSLNDSLNSKSRIREAQMLSLNEQIRQTELEEQKRIDRKQRKQQLQLLFIAIFIPGFFLLTLLLSRIRVSRRLITLSGVISLLILFEFLTLLLHPFVIRITGHRPFLEILIFVAVAAVLIPLHHKMEHWMIHNLTKARQRENSIKIKKKKLSVKVSKDTDEGNKKAEETPPPPQTD